MCLLLVATLFGVISLADEDNPGKNNCGKNSTLWADHKVLVHIIQRGSYTSPPVLLNVCNGFTLKVPITTAADDKFCDIFPNFRQK